MDVSIRTLTAADAAALAAFYRSLTPETIAVYGPFQPVDDDQLALFLRDCEAGAHANWGLVSADGDIEGHAFVRHLDKAPPEFGIGLRERAQGQGWGRRLMTTAMDWADDAELPVVMLSVYKINHRARNLYESQGFVVLRDYSCTGPDDSFYMERQRPTA